MYLKGRAHEKNGLILEAGAEMYFQREINSKSCIECGRNLCAREQEGGKKGKEPKIIQGLDNQTMQMPLQQTKQTNTKTTTTKQKQGNKHTNEQRSLDKSCHGQE